MVVVTVALSMLQCVSVCDDDDAATTTIYSNTPTAQHVSNIDTGKNINRGGPVTHA